jgi:hypothetical protein
MPPLDAGGATAATADVDVEPADQGAAWDFGLVLNGDVRFMDLCAAVWASVRQGRVEDFIDLIGRRRGAVGVATVGGARLASGFPGLWLGRPLGEGSGLAFGSPARLGEFGFEALVLLAEAFVVLGEALYFLAELVELAAEFLQLLKNGDGHGHRITDLD